MGVASFEIQVFFWKMTIKGILSYLADTCGYGRAAHYANPPLKYTPDEGNALIANTIRHGKGAMVARLGFVEAASLLNYQEIQFWINSKGNALKSILALSRGYRTKWDPSLCALLCSSAGFFPDDEDLIDRFCALFLDCMNKCDLAACFESIDGEDFLWKMSETPARFIPFASLESYRFASPWSLALTGKRILVVHPFAESIQTQYERKRELLFADPEVLPEFELSTLPAVQAMRGEKTRFTDWFAALEYMQEEIAAREFDVCLIGAGAFGVPLAAFVKSLGKVSVHMGAAAQILFGIRGKRWEEHAPEVANLFNEHWVRPLPEEHPRNFKSHEGGAYW